MKQFFIKIHPYLFYTFVFSLPWQTIWIIREIFYGSEKWQYGTIGIHAPDILLLAWIIIGIYLYKDTLLHYVSTHRRIFITGALLSLWGFLSITWSTNMPLALYCAIKLSLVIDLFFLLQATPINVRKTSIVFVASMSLHSIIGLYQFLTQSTFAHTLLGLQHHNVWHGSTAIINTDIERWLRVYGGLPHPNIFGGLLLVSLLLSIWLYVSQKDSSRISQFLLLSSVALISSNIILTFSRVTWIAAILSIILFFGFTLLQKNIVDIKKRIIVPLILLSLIIILFTALFTQLFTARKNDTSITHNSLGDRKTYLMQAHHSIKQKPVLGTGIGNYTNTIAKNEKNQKPIWYYQPVHNVFVLITAEIGFIGFILFCIFISLVFYNFQSKKRKFTLEKSVILLIIISILLISFFDHWPWTSHAGIFTFFLFLGLLHAKEKAACHIVT